MGAPGDSRGASGTPPSLRSLGLAVYAPSFLFAIGQGAIIPIVALAAMEVGASVAMAGFIVGLRAIGTMVSDIPAGMLVARVGERRAMSVGTAILVVSLVGAVLATTPAAFAAFMFLLGCGWSVWLLARLAYVSDVMPSRMRGRALSTLGGVNRIGNFVGPFLGAGAITLAGTDGAYYVHIAAGIAGWALLLAVRDPHAVEHPPERIRVPFREVLSEHAPVFRTAGVVALCIGVLRTSRQAVVPLWAAGIGLDAAQVAIVFGISSAIDMTLFYPAGSISDRFGRKSVAVPCMVLLAGSFLLLPATGSFVAIVLVGLLLGFGNGLGSGIVMTLGADSSPDRGRAEFLGVWRMVGDVGTSSGPLLASAVIAVATLAAASIAVGVVGLVGAGVAMFVMPEPLRRRFRAAGE